MKAYNRNKEELTELLDCHKGALTSSMINYLKSLINLEFSVVKNCISAEERKELVDTTLYRKIAAYNIQQMALKLLSEIELSKGLDVKVSNGNDKLNIRIKSGKQSFQLFDFEYVNQYEGHHYEEEKIKYGSLVKLKSKQVWTFKPIGLIWLFEKIVSSEQIEAEIERIRKRKEMLAGASNPYSFDRYYPREFQTCHDWATEKIRKICECDEYLKLLENRGNLTTADKRIMEFSQMFCELMLADYGLTMEDFERLPEMHVPELTDKYIVNGETHIDLSDKDSELTKTFVKTMPGMDVRKTTYYM